MNSDNLNYSDNALDTNNAEENKFVKNPILDKISDKYRIRSSSKIAELSNAFSQAYVVEDVNAIELPNIYAAILNLNLPARFSAINSLKRKSLNNLIMPIEVEISTLSTSNQQAIGIILPKPPLVSLRSYIEKNGSCSISYITNHILLPINSLLEKLSILNIAHGKINPDNIFINQNGDIILGECVTEICGYSQQYYYETIERSECQIFAKGEGDTAIDYFALGMVCLYAYLGKEVIDRDDKDFILGRRLENGSFKTFVGNIILPSNFVDLIKGLITDKAKDRWGSKQIIDWHDAVRYPTPSSDNREAKKHLIFNNRYYLNTRHLSYDLWKNWESAKDFLKDDALTRWIERGLNNSYLSENISYMTKSLKFSISKNDNDNILTRVLAMIDPTGPVKIKDFAIYIDSVFNLIAIGFAESKNDYLAKAYKLIDINLSKGVVDTSKHERKNITDDFLMIFNNFKKFITNTNLGYGLERCMYELNKFFPCQSTILSKEFITNNKELLESLETKASDSKALINDRHISAFFMSRLSTNMEKLLAPLKNYNELFQNREVNNLAIFACVQKETNIRQLPNLAKNFANNFTTVGELINNKEIREDFHKKFNKAAETGSLWVMLKFILDTNCFRRDQDGFKKALAKYISLEQQKSRLKEKDKLYELGYVYGLRLTVIISYLLCAVIFTILSFGE